MRTCSEYAKKIEETGLFSKNANDGVKEGLVVCGHCGRKVEGRLTFCSYCGAEKALYTQSRAVLGGRKNAVGDDGPNPAESTAELYRNNVTIYVRGLVPASGSLIITARGIKFTPQPLYHFNKAVCIALEDIAELSCNCDSVSGFMLKVTTKADVAHKFVLGTLLNADALALALAQLGKTINR